MAKKTQEEIKREKAEHLEKVKQEKIQELIEAAVIVGITVVAVASGIIMKKHYLK